MKHKRFLINARRRGQAMVEFALALPLLLLILFGILELGRLVFTYSSVVNASRQAVRYGSATGYVSNTASPFRYEDCAGIRAAAKNVSFGAGITDADVVINYYDVAGNKYPGCPPTDPALFDLGAIKTGSRIEVIVTGHWTSVVPGITGLSNRPLTSKSARTLLSTIYLRESAGAVSNPTSPGGGYDVNIPSDTPTDTPTRTNTPPPTFTATFGPSPTGTNTSTPSDTPTVTATASITPTRTATPLCPVFRVRESAPGGNTLFTVTFTNRGPGAPNAAGITINWPPAGGVAGGPVHLIAASAPGGFTWSGDLSSGSAAFYPFTPEIPIPVGSDIVFSFTFSAPFRSGINAGDIFGALTLNPMPLQCGGPVGY